MTAVFLFLLIVTISFVIVRIGAVALELTGLPWEAAKFQALSSFSTTGFTTREAEQILTHPLRRKIVSGLIVLGNAGLVTMVGTFVSSILAQRPVSSVGHVLLILGGVLVLGWGFHRAALQTRLREWIRAWLAKRYDFQGSSPAELLRLDEGYLLTKITLSASSPACGHQLQSLRLKQHRVQILAIERGARFLAVPRGEARLLANDKLVIYGVRQAIWEVFAPTSAESLALVEDTTVPNPLREAERELPPSGTPVDGKDQLLEQR